MKNVHVLLALVFVALEAHAEPDFDGLLGCWKKTGGGAVEAWTRLEEGDLLGFGISWADSDIRSWEHLAIRHQNDRTVLTAYPGGARGTPFELTSFADGYARFENPEHDFPQVIEYWWSATTLRAVVSAFDGDNYIEFIKERCDDN